MTKKQLEERIYEIASGVYEVDPEEPDPMQFWMQDKIRELINDVLVYGVEENQNI